MHLVLDPTIKDAYFRTRWESDNMDSAMTKLGNIVRRPELNDHHLLTSEFQFDQYYALKSTNNEPTTPTAPSTTVEPSPLHRYGSSFLLDAVKSARKDEQVTVQPRDELKQYLAAPLETTENILHWWGVSHIFGSQCSSELTHI
jgi:hypothetical protein